MIPETAKRKVIRRREWEGPSTPEPVVYLDLVEDGEFRRAFDVYAEDGTRLGQIGSYKSTIDMRVPGTRLRRIGRRRTFWETGPGSYWKQHPSQAEAIRDLLNN
jgi:hypothetical protein